MSAESEAKTVIIDEEWKKQVEAERAAAQAVAEAATTKTENERPLPTPDLIFLAGTLYMQGMIGLGLMANPVSGKAEVSLAHAKHGIDSLDVLQAKTAGNRTPDESQVIENMLHELRMAYLAAIETKS